MLDWLKPILGDGYNEEIDNKIAAEINKGFVAKADYDAAKDAQRTAAEALAEYKDTVALAYYKEALDLQNGYMPALLGESEVYRTRRNFPEFFRTLNMFVSDDQTDVHAKTQYLGMLVTRRARIGDTRIPDRFLGQDRLESVAVHVAGFRALHDTRHMAAHTVGEGVDGVRPVVVDHGVARGAGL